MSAFRRSERVRFGDLPPELTTFVGRREQLLTAQALLDMANLLTLVGPGGVGKTRLALRLAHVVRESHPELVVRWARLSTLDSSASTTLVEQTAAEALGVTDMSHRSPLEALAEHLTGRAHSATSDRWSYLLILDNCEHLIERVGELVAALLEIDRGLRILATSRELLGCQGERLFLVPPLTFPTLHTAESVPPPWARYESLDLLADRAAAAGFPIDSSHRAAAARLCERLDGNPLAIELAAAGLRHQSLDEIVTGLQGSPTDARFRLLTGGPRHGSHPMHHSLRAVVDWSYELCSPKERIVWERVSVFDDGWDLPGAEAVCADSKIESDEIFGLLSRLVDKSLVIADTHGTKTRYRLPETLKQYGHARVVQRGEEVPLLRRHRDYYGGLLETAAIDWFSPRQLDWLDWARTEWSNIRAAIDWSTRTSEDAVAGLRAAINLARIHAHFFLGHLGEARGWLEELATATSTTEGTDDLRVSALARASMIALCQGSSDGSVLLDSCRSIAGSMTPPCILLCEGAHALLAERDRGSIALLDRALLAFDQADLDGPGDSCMALLLKALAAAWYAERGEALLITKECLDRVYNSGAEWTISWAMLARGIALAHHGDPQYALIVQCRALQMQKEMGDRWGTVWAVHSIAWALVRLLGIRHPAVSEPAVRAARHIARVLGAADMIRNRTGVALSGLGPLADAISTAEEIVQSRLGRRGYLTAFNQGHKLSYDDAIRVSLGESVISDMPQVAVRGAEEKESTPWNTLTETEKQIALLVAQGLTNREIASRRVVSVRTVEKHLEHIRGKLPTTGRADIASWVPRTLAQVSSVPTPPGYTSDEG